MNRQCAPDMTETKTSDRNTAVGDKMMKNITVRTVIRSFDLNIRKVCFNVGKVIFNICRSIETDRTLVVEIEPVATIDIRRVNE